jgi:tripartite-type tricarboxylate transporter receptor subunit TctC
MKTIRPVAAIFLSLASIATVTAQPYPSRPITMVVPFPAGGATDIVLRVVSEQMRMPLDQPVIIDNVSGAGGSIGVARAARAMPDGYTLSGGQLGTHVLSGAIYPVSYDLLNDLDPVALLSTSPGILVGRNDLPPKDLNSLIAWVKDNSGKALMGTGGKSAPGHVAGVFFQRVTHSDFQLVPYRSTSLAMQDLLGGRIDIMIDNPATSLPQVRAGQIKAYAVTAAARIASARDIPTVDEAGLPGFYFSNWTGLWVPKGTPKNVVARLNAAVVEALANPAVQSRLLELGHEVVPRDQQAPQALAAIQKAEIEKWWPIIKAANIRGE